MSLKWMGACMLLGSSVLLSACGNNEEANNDTAAVAEQPAAQAETQAETTPETDLNLPAMPSSDPDMNADTAMEETEEAMDATGDAVAETADSMTDEAADMAEEGQAMMEEGAASAMATAEEMQEAVTEEAQDAAETVAKAAADGEATYKSICFSCHNTGLAGSPKLGDAAAWKPRIAKGTEVLYQSAIEGMGTMPPKGGLPTLTDAEVKAAVDYMVDQVQ